MTKTIKFISILAGALVLASCDSNGIDPTDLDAKEDAFKKILTPYCLLYTSPSPRD